MGVVLLLPVDELADEVGVVDRFQFRVFQLLKVINISPAGDGDEH
jgi:hypothetical protein